MANFQPVTAGILKEHRIVTEPFQIARAFDPLRPGFNRDPGQSVYIGGTRGPKCDPALIRYVLR